MYTIFNNCVIISLCTLPICGNSFWQDFSLRLLLPCQHTRCSVSSMHKPGLPSDLNGCFFLTCILNSIMEPLHCNTGIRSVCPCQILLGGFVQTNKRPCPCVSLVFSRGIGHLLSGVYQGQDGVLKIVLMQVTNVIWKARDEPQCVCQLPRNDLLTDGFQVFCLAERSQLSILHWKLSTILKVYSIQQDLADDKKSKKKLSVFIIEVYLLVKHFRHLFMDMFVSLQIKDLWKSCGRKGSQHLLPIALFCSQVGIGLVGRERTQWQQGMVEKASTVF